MKLHIAPSDIAMRELAERQERDRWLKEIRSIVRAAKLPVALRSSDEAIMIRVPKGRRPNTLRKHVKTWMKASRWLQAAGGLWLRMAEDSGPVHGVPGGDGRGAMRQKLS